MATGMHEPVGSGVTRRLFGRGVLMGVKPFTVQVAQRAPDDVQHDHVSVPADLEQGQAVLSLTPSHVHKDSTS
jgi:hypothetical protein